MAEARSRLLILANLRSFTVGLILTLMVVPVTSDASWFVDVLRYHVSAHGRISCQDCHADVAGRAIHPDPADVKRSRTEFLNSASCFNCHDHDSFKANLGKGLHGGKPIEKAYNYSDCISCHNPHYQPHLNKKGASAVGVVAQNAETCGKCHEAKEALPPPAEKDAKCLECHRTVDSRDSRRTEKIAVFCLACHEAGSTKAGATAIPLIDAMKHIAGGHSRLNCLYCHLEAAKFEHHRQPSVTCRRCHTPHHEATIHDVHATVSCQACHLGDIKAKRNNDTGRVVWARSSGAAGATQLNILRPNPNKDFCQRCHYAGNTVAAAAIILPAKSIICMPCHASTFSAKDTSSVLALVGFGLGMCVVASVWLSAASSLLPRGEIGLVNRSESTAGRRLVPMLRSLFLDVLFQRRLFIRSRSRWLIHGLIFWPFVLRFGWGLVALAGSLMVPTHDWVWKMLDKNDPLTAFVFDFTGVMIIAGIISMVLRKRIVGEVTTNGLPKHDWWAIGFLGAIVVVGFILEGARIAMTGPVNGAHYAFVGWAVSLLWRGTNGLSEIYGYIWYLHAFLTGAFLVYLPFSRLFHIIIAPLITVLNALDSSHRDHRPPTHTVR